MSDSLKTLFQEKKSVLHFSGGKDSIACLYLLKPYWDQIDVMWLNTGAALPETIAQMAAVKAMVPRFIEVNSDQPTNIEMCGIPSDIVPVSHTPLHNVATGDRKPLIQSFMDCCSANIWQPMHEASKNYEVIIRGQKDADHKKAPVKSGQQVAGIYYCFPIESWTDEQVYQYLSDHGIELPPTYKYFGSSADCWSCTAYLSENEGKRPYLKEFHPEKYAIVAQRIEIIKSATLAELANL